MRLLKWECENFSIFEGKHSIDLSHIPFNSVIGVMGINKDGQGGYLSNGAGKSSFVNSICWCITDKMPQQFEKETLIAKTDIVNKFAKKRASVTLTIEDDNKDTIEFTNSRTPSGSRRVTLLINGTEFKCETDSQATEKFHSLIGFGGKNKGYFIDFMSHTFFNGNITSGFASKNFSPAQRIEVVSRIKQLEVVDLCIVGFNSKIKTINSEIENIKYNLEKLRENFEEHTDINQSKVLLFENNEKLKESKDLLSDLYTLKDIHNEIVKLETELTYDTRALVDIERKIDQKISEIKFKIKSINEDLKTLPEIERKIKTLAKKIEIIEDEVVDAAGDIESLKSDYTFAMLEQNGLRKEITLLVQEIENFDSQHFLTCPSCQSSLLFDENDELIKYDIDTHKIQRDKKFNEFKEKEAAEDKLIEQMELIQKTIREREEVKDQKKKAINNFNSQISIYKNDIKEISDRKIKILQFAKLNSSEYILKEEYSEYSNYEEYKAQLNIINKKKHDIQEMKSEGYIEWLQVYPPEKIDPSIRQLNENILNLELVKKDLENKIQNHEKIKKDIKDNQELLQQKTKDSEILEKQREVFVRLKNLEVDETGPILEEMTNKNLQDLGVDIEVAYDVSIDEGKFDITIIEDSGNDLPLALFSDGQAKRISLAAGLALRSMNSTDKVDMGFSIWDEVFDSLDDAGKDLFSSLLNSFEGLKFIISHSSHIKRQFKYVIVCERENHRTKIYLEENK